VVKKLCKLVFLLISFSFFLFSGCKKERVPIVKTHEVSQITSESAVAGGNVTEPGIGKVESRGVCWSRNKVPTVNNSITVDGSGLGRYTSSMTGLTPNTTYYVRAYAINGEGVGYGDVVNYTTKDPPDLANVITAFPSDVFFRGATVNCSIPDDGGGHITRRGICYSTSQNPTLSDRFVDDKGEGKGFYSIKLDELEYGTLFYVRAFAVNSTGVAYGNEVAFTTSAKPPVGTQFGGGVIAYFFQPGDPGYVDGIAHGIIASSEDEGIFHWGCMGIDIPGTSTAMWTGQANTEAIMNICSQTGNASFVCVNANRGGYTDWFLPSLNELNLLYHNRMQIGNFTSSLYWSSSAGTNDVEAHALVFQNGSQVLELRSETGRIRPIRIF
jgi:hypothetical protein